MNPFMGQPGLDAPDGMGLRPLHKACLVGDWETVTNLVGAGADPRATDHSGKNAMWYALLHLKGSRHNAARAFARAGVNLAEEEDDELTEMPDSEAKSIGKQIFERCAAEAGVEIS